MNDAVSFSSFPSLQLKVESRGPRQSDEDWVLDLSKTDGSSGCCSCSYPTWSSGNNRRKHKQNNLTQPFMVCNFNKILLLKLYIYLIILHRKLVLHARFWKPLSILNRLLSSFSSSFSQFTNDPGLQLKAVDLHFADSAGLCNQSIRR